MTYHAASPLIWAGKGAANLKSDIFSQWIWNLTFLWCPIWMQQVFGCAVGEWRISPQPPCLEMSRMMCLGAKHIWDLRWWCWAIWNLRFWWHQICIEQGFWMCCWGMETLTMSTMPWNVQNYVFRDKIYLRSEVTMLSNLKSQIFVASNMHWAGVLDVLLGNGDPHYVHHALKCPKLCV